MAPCEELPIALGLVTATRRYIRVTGPINVENALIDGGKSVWFLGADRNVAGALTSALAGPGGNNNGQPTLRINGEAKVEIHQLVLRDSREAAIEVEQGSLVLRRSQINNTDKEGVKIDSPAAKVEIHETDVLGNGTDSMGGSFYAGILLSDGELTVTRSRISGGMGGGVLIASGKKFSITSSFITENRGNGGISATSPAAGSRLEFNTIADNQDEGDGLADAGGVLCDLPSFVASNNIIYRNTSDGTDAFVQTIGRCTYGNSLVSANNAAETRVLGFVKDTAPRDYHLTAASPAIVKDVASCTAAAGFVDYDGDLRPQGGACELGADEIKQ